MMPPPMPQQGNDLRSWSRFLTIEEETRQREQQMKDLAKALAKQEQAKKAKYFPPHSVVTGEEPRKQAPVLLELHFHKGRGAGKNKWYLTDVVRNTPDSKERDCKDEECTILTVDLWAAEFLENGEYTWVDTDLLKKGL